MPFSSGSVDDLAELEPDSNSGGGMGGVEGGREEGGDDTFRFFVSDASLPGALLEEERLVLFIGSGGSGGRGFFGGCSCIVTNTIIIKLEW